MAVFEARRILERSARLPVVEEYVDGKRSSVDALFRMGDTCFAVQVKSNARSATVAQAIARLREYEKEHRGVSLLLIVPFMGQTGAEICDRASVNWVDLQGNASIHVARVHVHIRGKREGGISESLLQPETGINPFSPKASRIVHAILTKPKGSWSRAGLEAITGVEKGYLSKIVAALSERGYVERTPSHGSSAIRVVDPVVLLDAWREKYKPGRPMSWGLIAARDGSETSRQLAHILSDAGVSYALTGLASAAHYTDFGSFRRVDAYLAKPLPESAAARLRAGTEERGRNVALYLDPGNTSIGVTKEKRIYIASAVLTYLDLSHIPERSVEAAEAMRRYLEQQWK